MAEPSSSSSRSSSISDQHIAADLDEAQQRQPLDGDHPVADDATSAMDACFKAFDKDG